MKLAAFRGNMANQGAGLGQELPVLQAPRWPWRDLAMIIPQPALLPNAHSKEH